jgi:AcrR family transcriptional regulator
LRKPKQSRPRKPARKAKPAHEDLRKLKGMESRDRILDSAFELFSQRGYAATGVYDIARTAGIEKTALYWHFGSKEGLLAAVLDRLDAQFVEEIKKRVAQGGGESARLDLFIDGLRRLAAERADVIRLLIGVTIERADVSEETRAAMERVYERTRLAVATGFEQSLGVKLPDVDLIARLVLAYLWEAAVRAHVTPDRVEHERFFAHLGRLIELDVRRQLAQLAETKGQPARRRTRR